MKIQFTLRKLLVLLVALMLGIPTTGRAQNESKYSASTLMFLDERDGNIELPKLKQQQTLELQLEKLPGVDKRLKQRSRKRPIAEAEEVNGTKMISAFVAVDDNNFSALESLGVKIEAKFNKLATTLIPVDKIEDVAALSNVTKIEVAEILEPQNDVQRTVTQAYDAMNNTSNAQALGLTSPYTGKGVILGVIDTGIDFQHIAFKDKNGNNRIVRAYKLSGSNSTSLTTYSSASQISALTYDTNDGDHGTHTVSTAGGSSVIVSGSNVSVTDDHTQATYGGMAPEADLVVAGLSSLYTTSIGTAIQNICNYADDQGKPCVISLSLGSQVGPHDGTGSIASIVNQYAGNNHIIVYAASNDGMRADAFVEMGTSNGGGMYASGTSTSSKPMIVNVQRSFSNADGNVEMLMPTICAYARTAGVATSLKFHVVNVSTGAVVYSSSAYSSSTTIDVTGSSGLAQYFKSSSSYSNSYGDTGKIRLVRTQDSNNSKYYWMIYAPIMLSTSYSDSDGDGIYNSDYAFCVSVYPTSTSSSTVIDMWENAYSWFGTDLNLSSSSYNYCKGNDECSVSDNACYSKVISVGAYVTKNVITDSEGTAHDFSDSYPNIGDHAYFSSWQTAGYGPLGTALPHINAPGARIVAGVNHYHTTSVDDYSYYGDDYKSDLVVNNTNYPYAAMEGTSMATPCVSGIIAQWLQACGEAGKTPTPDYIKEVMENTWDTDEWTNGTGSGAHGAKTFGTHGKINAIKGIQYILGTTAGPTITATPTSLSFTDAYTTQSYEKTINVKGVNLTGDISLSLSDATGSFSLSQNSISKSAATDGVDVTVTYTPTTVGNHTATITLTSADADNVVVNLTGSAQDGTVRYTVTFDPGTGRVTPDAWTQETLNQSTTLPTAQSPDSDYNFLGWATAAVNETTTQPTVLAAGTSYQPTANVTLYAVYTQTITTGSGNYELVTSTPSDWSGQYLIVYTSGKLALKGSLTANSTSNTLSVTITNNAIPSTSTTDAESFTIEPYGSGYSIQGASGRYIYGGNNTISYATSAYANTISLSGSDATISYAASSGWSGTTTYTLKYYSRNNSKYFRYTSSTNNAYAVQLYKKQPGTETTYTSFPTVPSIGGVARLIDDLLNNSSTPYTKDNVGTMVNKILWK